MITTPYEKIQNDLRSIPKEQLMSMGNNPSPQYPTYMIATEMQRRVQEEKAMAAQQTRDQAGQPTVIEGVMDEFANTDGLSQAQPMMEMNQQMPQEGIQMMATGGRVGYKAGGQLEFLKSLGISEDDLRSYFNRQQLTQQSNIPYSQDVIEQFAPQQLEQIQRDIIGHKSSRIRDDFYDVGMVGGPGLFGIGPPEREMYMKDGLSRPMQNEEGGPWEGYGDIGDPSLFPEGESFGFQTGRQRERDYFTGAGAKNMGDISTFIAGNKEAYAVYQKAGGGQSGIEAVIGAGLLGEVDPLTNMPVLENPSAFNIDSYVKKYSTEEVEKLKKGDPNLIQEIEVTAQKRLPSKDLRTIKQILDVQDEIGTDTSGYDTFNAPDYAGLRRNESRDDIYKAARERIGLADYNTEDILTGLEGMVDKLPVPDYEVPTERERQSELSGMGLAILGKAIGGARNLGEAAVTIGEGVPELGKLKKGQREEANAILAMDRAMAIEAANMKTALAGLDLQYKNADNTTKIQLEGIVTNEVARNDAFNEHLDTLKLNYDKMDFAHKELLANIGAKDRDAAIAIVKLDQLKTQAEKVAEGVYKKTLLATYDAMLTELEAIQDDLGETSGARIAQLNRNLDNTLSALLSNLDVGGSVGGQTLNPSDLTSMIANK